MDFHYSDCLQLGDCGGGGEFVLNDFFDLGFYGEFEWFYSMNSGSIKPDVSGITERLDRIEQAVSMGINSSDLDVRDLFRTIWAGRWFVFVVTVVCAAISITVALLLPNQYKAAVVLAPASTSSGSSSLSRLAGQFGNLAALAGVNLGAQSENDKTIYAMELIKSWGFQEQFIHDNQLEVDVFASKGWNRETNKLVIDPNTYDLEKNKWVRKFNAKDGQSAEPSGWELYEKLSKKISVAQDKKTNLVTLSVEYYSPYLAKEWVDKIVIAVNKHLQDQDRLEASKSIKYLQEKMNETSLTEMKSIFSRLIEEQTKNLMLADISDEYVLKTLTPAKVPEKKSQPPRAIICVLGTLLGGFLGAIAWVWSRSFKSPTTSG